jgi:alanyl-tRNA synthetase
MIRHGAKLGIENNFSKVLAQEVIKKMSTAYPLLKENEKFILAEIEKEENKFRKTLKRGLKELKKLLEKGQEIMGDKAFYLYETFGFPLEMIFEELELEKDDMTRIKKDFKKAMQEHKEKSRAGMDKKFKGGLADNKEIHKKYHTATHLLLRALQEVLGDHVHQAGSNITAKRLRFDFTHSDQLTEEEIGKVEEIVNTKIKENLNVFRTDMSKETAKKIPNVEFMEHVDYPDIVSVYSIGLEEEPYDNTEGKLIDTTELRDKFKDAYTVEFCMGPHVENTSELAKKGEFKIIDQDNIGAGKVRVKGVLMV